ncbi:MAG: NAD(P)-binding domain-containing protein [Pseudomonadota bacterium]
MSEIEHAQAHAAPIEADDATIAAALEDAHIPSLVLALIHMTGDMSLVRGDIRPLVEFLNPDDGLTDAQRAQVRERALAVLSQHRDNPGEFFAPGAAELREMMNFITGQEISDDYIEFLSAELSMHGEDAYAQPEVYAVPEHTRADFTVLIIGAGMSGLLSAIRLQQAGINFIVVEKNADVGGTWLENTYPGCRVDSANHVYSYSFRPQDWPQHFSAQPVLRQYFADTANEYKLREHIRFGTEVHSAAFDVDSGLWQVEASGPEGAVSLQANAVISAVGQLNRPNMPEIKGMQDFTGPTWHSAEWRHDIDLTGKRVGVIGTGGSAFQFVPVIADHAESIKVFQRTAPWIVPNESYFQEVPEGKHWLLQHVPFYAKWFRFNMFWTAAEGLLEAVTGEADWDRPEESVSAKNSQFRDSLIANLQETLAGRDDLIEICTPNYPPGAKRALIDDGKYLRTLLRDDVTLLSEPIETITPTGIRTSDGTEHEFDVLIYGTGFKASSFLHPMKIYGLDGKELHDVWQDEPRAFKGISIPGFPNLFCTYGPNTNIVVNGSIIFFSECEVRYIVGCLAMLMQSNSRALDVKAEVHQQYNEWIDKGNAGMAWGQSGVNTWYKNAAGHITQNWPYSMLEFWQQTRAPAPDDYHLIG